MLHSQKPLSKENDDTLGHEIDAPKNAHAGLEDSTKSAPGIVRHAVTLRSVSHASQTNPHSTSGAGKVSTRSRVPLRTQLLAGITIFMMGLLLGYGTGRQDDSLKPGELPVDSFQTEFQEVSAYQKLLKRQPRHLAEVPASQIDEISTWLTTTLGIAFRIPDLTNSDWRFEGARIVLLDSKPTGQLIYSNTDSEVMSIYFWKDENTDELKDFKETIKDDTGIITWTNAGTIYALAAPSAEASLHEMAEAIAKAI